MQRSREALKISTLMLATVLVPAASARAQAAGAEFFSVTPCRVVDTRNPDGPTGGPALAGGQTRPFPVSGGTCGVPATAVAVSVNLTAVGAAAAGYLTLFAGDAQSPPLVSSINFTAGLTRANNAVVPLATDGSGTIKVTSGSVGAVDFVLDVNGYFLGPGTPALVQNVSSSTNPVGIGISGNNFKFTLPNDVLAGNALVLKVAYASGASFAATPVTDSNGNVWPTVPQASVADSHGNVNLAVFVLPNANPGETTITVHFTAPVRPFQYDCGEWMNIAPDSPVSGSLGASAVAGPIAAAGSFTPANNDLGGGNLVLYYVHTDDNPGSGNSASSIVAGSGFTLLDADIAWGTDTNSYHASAYQLQRIAAPVNPSMTVTTAPGNEHFVVLAIALKAAAGGTAPLPGIRILKLHHFTNEVPPTAWSIQFPTTGSNLVVAVTTNAPNSSNTTITSVTDNHGNAYVKTEPSNDEPQWWVAEGASTSSDTKLTFHMNGGSAGMSMRIFEITGAAASGAVDAAGGMTANCSNLSSISAAPTITPATANGLTIATMFLGLGPGLSVTAPAGALFDLVTYSGEVDMDTMENADAVGHLYNGSTATESWSWTITSLANNSCHASAIHLRAQ
jgi:hypothetical protein